MFRRFPLARLALVLLLAAGVGWMLTHQDLLRLESIEPVLRALGIWAPIGFVLIYATATVLFFSGGVLGLPGRAPFGPVWGSLWNLIGATLGATAGFLLARTAARGWVARHVGGGLRRLVEGVTAEGWRFVALMRLVPLVPFNLLNYALGLTGISLPAYVLTSAICMLPGAVAYTWLGYAGRSAAVGDTEAVRYGLLGFGVLAMIAFLPRLFGRFRTQEPAWIESDECSAGLRLTIRSCCSMSASPTNSPHHPGTCRAR